MEMDVQQLLCVCAHCSLTQLLTRTKFKLFNSELKLKRTHDNPSAQSLALLHINFSNKLLIAWLILRSGFLSISSSGAALLSLSSYLFSVCTTSIITSNHAFPKSPHKSNLHLQFENMYGGTPQSDLPMSFSLFRWWYACDVVHCVCM